MCGFMKKALSLVKKMIPGNFEEVLMGSRMAPMTMARSLILLQIEPRSAEFFHRNAQNVIFPSK